MNNFLLATLSIVFITTSCFQQGVKEEAKSDLPTENVIDTTQSNFKYKSEIRKELEGYFAHKKRGESEQVMPKYMGGNRSGIYCYFFVRGKKAVSLKLHIEYPDYDADLYEIKVGDQTMTYEANKKYTSSGSAQVVENATFWWYDHSINLSDEEFLEKIEAAGEATLNLKVQETDKLLATIKLTKEECQSMARTIKYYKALDGSKIPKKGMVNIRG